MKKYIVAIVFGLLFTFYALAGQTLTTVSITSSSAGTQIVASIGGGVVVMVPSSAAVPVWVAMTDGSCPTTLTATRGIRITAGNGYFFTPKTEQWTGQLCGILESGAVAVSVSVNSF